MFVENIMTREVLHVGPEASFSQVSEIMRLKKVRHVPVIDQDRKVLGIISHRDVQRAQPSMITTLDVGEVKYLLSKITAADIMHKSVVSCSPRTQIEEAAHDRSVNAYARRVRVVRAELGGDAPLVGAAALVHRRDLLAP